jgi:hypothetical protein
MYDKYGDTPRTTLTIETLTSSYPKKIERDPPIDAI